MSSNKDNLFIILTIPHSKCIPDFEINHNCDPIALDNAIEMKESFKKRGIKDENIVILKGNFNRFEIDLNREESKDTNFHKELDKLIIQNKELGKKVLVFDIHSGTFRENKRIIRKHLILLDLPSKMDNRLIDNVMKTSMATRLIGSDENYIVKKSLDNNIESLLIEFNEKKKHNGQVIDKLTESLIE